MFSLRFKVCCAASPFTQQLPDGLMLILKHLLRRKLGTNQLSPELELLRSRSQARGHSGLLTLIFSQSSATGQFILVIIQHNKIQHNLQCSIVSTFYLLLSYTLYRRTPRQCSHNLSLSLNLLQLLAMIQVSMCYN